MSAFNIIVDECKCPICDKIGEFNIQFKYGDTWQRRYKIGDLVKWGGNDIGSKSATNVRIEGVGEACPNCKSEYLEFDIFVVCNRIDHILGVGKERANALPEGYEIIK